MSTDPREFEHPIDGTGGNVTPAAIEAAARALFERDYDPNSQMAWEEISEDARDRHRTEASFALSAAYPLMEAQAKAEALREAAGELSGVCADFAYMRADGLIEYATPEDWLLARAATIEGKSE